MADDADELAWERPDDQESSLGSPVLASDGDLDGLPGFASIDSLAPLPTVSARKRDKLWPGFCVTARGIERLHLKS